MCVSDMWAGLEGLCGCQVGRSRSFLRFTDLACSGSYCGDLFGFLA